MNQKVALMASAGLGMAFLAACSDSATSPNSSKFVSEVSFAAGAVTATPAPTAVVGRIIVCKTGNQGGSFSFARSTVGTVGVDYVGNGPIVIAVNTCLEVANDASPTGFGSNITVTEGAPPANTVQTITACKQAGVGVPVTDCVFANGGNLFLNSFHGYVITYNNVFTPPPPPAICDFITFGRLVWEEGDDKVVISGNAGGNSPDGGFLNEFHIEVNGVDHHVADITSYGPIAAAPLASSSFTNSRRAAGLDKHGHAVELRVWDGGEPGWKFDRFWFNVNGTIVGNATNGNLIDQGNMQYHANCRGPGDE